MRIRNLVGGVVGAALALTMVACGSETTPTGGTSGSSAPCTVAPPSATVSASAPAPAPSSAPASAPSEAPPAAGGAGLVDKAKGGKLTVGIKYDQPGLGLKTPDGKFTGFDVEVAKYVAKKLGVEEAGITFVETKSAEREDKIAKGEVDFIVATYSITATRKEKVNFAGPYFIAHQDLLVKADDTSICGPNDLNGKILCSVKGSTPAQKIKSTYAAETALQEFGTYSECVEQLKAGVVNAVTTDDVILAGYAAQSPGAFKVVGNGFTDENYGIGLRKGDEAGTKALNDAIKAMVDDGSWKKALEDTVGPSGYKIPAPPTVG